MRLGTAAVVVVVALMLEKYLARQIAEVCGKFMPGGRNL